MNFQALIKIFIISTLCALNICNGDQTKSTNSKTDTFFKSASIKTETIVQPASKVLEIPLPEGYSRIKSDSLSFEYYLQNLPLNTHDNNIYSFDGTILSTGGYHYAIIDMDIGTKDLQQCADAVMRLRAEYLFKQKKYKEIHFNFLSDGKPRYYTDYSNGNRTYAKFKQYLDYIFSYANSSSLRDEMLPVNQVSEIRIGDVFVQKGNPIGHAVIVVDMAINTKNGQKIILIAQSFMPAQSIHILLDLKDEKLSPWYAVDFEDYLTLPSWTFLKKDLRRFK
jgi:hypothetical protein